MPPIPDEPTEDDARAALALLLDLYTEFPFVSRLDESVAVAGLMAPVLRGAFNPAPQYRHRAPSRAAGKSYAMDLKAYLTTGQPCPVITDVDNREEMEK